MANKVLKITLYQYGEGSEAKRLLHSSPRLLNLTEGDHLYLVIESGTGNISAGSPCQWQLNFPPAQNFSGTQLYWNPFDNAQEMQGGFAKVGQVLEVGEVQATTVRDNSYEIVVTYDGHSYSEDPEIQIKQPKPPMP